MRYVEKIDMTGATSSLIVQSFSANGIYDPNITGIGHQPLGHDQWLTFYNHYCVIGSRINVQWVNDDNTENYIVGIHLDSSAGLSASLNTNMENPDTIWRPLSNDHGGYSMCNTALQCSPPKRLRMRTNNSLIRGEMNVSNPTEQLYYNLFSQLQDTTATPSAELTAYVTIDYIVLLTEPKDLSAS